MFLIYKKYVFLVICMLCIKFNGFVICDEPIDINNQILTINTLSGKKLSLNVDAINDESIRGIKLALFKLIKIPPEMQVLVFAGQVLTEGTLFDYGITNGDQIYLLVKLTIVPPAYPVPSKEKIVSYFHHLKMQVYTSSWPYSEHCNDNQAVNCKNTKLDPKDFSLHLDYAYALYQEAFKRITANKNPVPVILGSQQVRNNIGLLKHFGWVYQSEDRENINLQVAKQSINPLLLDEKGMLSSAAGILVEKHWSLLLNDLFLLAGIHAGIDFYAFEESISSATDDTINGKENSWEFILNHAPENTVRIWTEDDVQSVFSRECLILKIFGYKANFTKFGLVFTEMAPKN